MGRFRLLPRPHTRGNTIQTRCAVIRSLLSSSILLSFVVAHAQPYTEAPERCLTGDWISEVAHFVAEETGIPVPNVCVRFGKSDQLKKLAQSGVPRAHTNDVAAIFVPATREILLANDLEPSTTLGRSYLVHEMVHAQQFARHMHERASCPGKLEGEAYNLQALYLSAGELREDAFLLQVVGMLQSACEYTY